MKAVGRGVGWIMPDDYKHDDESDRIEVKGRLGRSFFTLPGSDSPFASHERSNRHLSDGISPSPTEGTEEREGQGWGWGWVVVVVVMCCVLCVYVCVCVCVCVCVVLAVLTMRGR